MSSSRLEQTFAGEQLRWVLPAGVVVASLTFLLLIPIISLYFLSVVLGWNASGDVDPEQFVPEGEVMPGRTYAHRLVSIGRLVPRKGFATVIAALRTLLPVGGSWDAARIASRPNCSSTAVRPALP